MKAELVSLSVLSLLTSLVSTSQQSQSQSKDKIVSGSALDDLAADTEIKVPEKAPDNTGEDTTQYLPWTHKPVCTDYLEELGDKLCVYTNAKLSNGRGISIFTTPSVAEKLASLPIFQDPTSLSDKGINPTPDHNGQLWYTSAIPNKGIGMLASRPLERGNLITAYTPYMLTHMENILPVPEREYYYRLALEQLPQANQEKFLSLAKIHNDPSLVVQDVVKANSFGMEYGGLQHLAVFPETSRFNHACAPNAQYFLSPDLITHYVHAVRPIAKDEELTISYSPPLRLHAYRQDYFQRTFQFNCSCTRCTSSEHRTIADSDRTTEDIVTLQQSLGRWDDESTASVKDAEELIRLYKEEGLHAFLDDPYGHAALMYNSVGSVRGAKKYAKLAAEASFLKYGADDGKVRDWEEIARDPTRHGSWKRRSKEQKTEL